MGLAILGSIAASAILADWHRQAASLPPTGQQRAALLGADVAGGQVHVVAASVGQDALYLAVASFLRGFELALLLAGVILAAAGLVGFRGLRHLRSPASTERHDGTRQLPGRCDIFAGQSEAGERNRIAYKGTVLVVVMAVAARCRISSGRRCGPRKCCWRHVGRPGCGGRIMGDYVRLGS
jgi:hypothetical protein